MKLIDLRKGFGQHTEYELSRFPDNSLKMKINPAYLTSSPDVMLVTSFRTNDDLIVLGLAKQILDYHRVRTSLQINYMMYQQDDRMFSTDESFGLKLICSMINQMNFEHVTVFHPHSDKIEMIDRCYMQDNSNFLGWFFYESNSKVNYTASNVWVIPDEGAFKTQFKQIQKFNQSEYVTCLKSRDHVSGAISTIVQTDDLQKKDCFIVDDICLGGRTFIQIAEQLIKKNCGKLSLVVSHGVFNNGIDHLLNYFDTIYTTDSICTQTPSERLRIYKL